MKTDKEKIDKVYALLKKEYGYDPKNGLFIIMLPDGGILSNVANESSLYKALMFIADGLNHTSKLN